MFPLASFQDFSNLQNLAIAVALGFGFGFSLERAGFGSARKLTAVFYLYDMAVVKVMFTAIVTAMTGIVVLSATGLLDIGELYVEPTNIAAQALGGVLFGAGFMVGGYCPGTSIAAMATGKKDGLAFALGMFGGVLAYAELTPEIDTWIKDTAQGTLTLPAITGIGAGWWALAFIAFLAFAGWGMGKLESRFGYLRPSAG